MNLSEKKSYHFTILFHQGKGKLYMYYVKDDIEPSWEWTGALFAVAIRQLEYNDIKYYLVIVLCIDSQYFRLR